MNRRGQLEHIRAAIAECEREHTDAEVREAAIALGREDLLPDPQECLPLEFAA